MTFASLVLWMMSFIKYEFLFVRPESVLAFIHIESKVLVMNVGLQGS